MQLSPVKTPLHHVHHVAYRCRDAEQTRWFWEDIMGFELTIGLAQDRDPGSGLRYEFLHLFFRMGDGNMVAFFDAPDDASEALFAPKTGFDMHIAFECESRDELLAWRQRLNDAGIPTGAPIDHDFVESVYCYDPNGIQVEVTVKTPKYDQVVAEESRQVGTVLHAWTASTRDRKERAFGAEKLDQRAQLCVENMLAIIQDSIDKAPPEVAAKMRAGLAAAITQPDQT